MINSRQKGKLGEREAAKYLAGLGFSARRTQQYNGLGLSDVVIVGVDLHIEVKFCYPIGVFDLGLKKWQDAIHQAQRDAAGKPWLILWKPKYSRQWRATLIVDGLIVTLASDDDIANAIIRLMRK